jgi:hypothetical protein
MTPDDFRRIALSLPATEESNGMGYANFRAERKSFATIEDSMAVIRLTRDQQAVFVATAPEVFAPVAGGWGRLGRTIVRLEIANEATVQVALATAWGNVVKPDAVAANAANVDVPDLNFADAVKDADAVYVAGIGAEVVAVDLPGVAGPGGAADIAHIPDAVDVADATNVPDTVTVVDAADVEPRDHLQSVIERLQVCWEPKPAPPHPPP